MYRPNSNHVMFPEQLMLAAMETSQANVRVSPHSTRTWNPQTCQSSLSSIMLVLRSGSRQCGIWGQCNRAHPVPSHACTDSVQSAFEPFHSPTYECRTAHPTKSTTTAWAWLTTPMLRTKKVPAVAGEDSVPNVPDLSNEVLTMNINGQVVHVISSHALWLV